MPSDQQEYDPEHYVIGSGTYDNLRRAIIFDNEEVFSIVPKRLSIYSLTTMNLIYLLFYLGFYFLATRVGQMPAAQVLPAFVAIAVLTCLGFSGYTIFAMRRAQRLGPYLIYEKGTGRLILPREKVVLDQEELIHLQLVTSRNPQIRPYNRSSNFPCSELNVIGCSQGVRGRWTVLREQATSRPLMDIVQPLIALTPIAIYRYRVSPDREITIFDMREQGLGRELVWH